MAVRGRVEVASGTFGLWPGLAVAPWVVMAIVVTAVAGCGDDLGVPQLDADATATVLPGATAATATARSTSFASTLRA